MKKLFLISALLLSQIDIYSCTCIYQPLKDQYDRADIIFTGRVIEGPFYYYSNNHYKFLVNKFYKGNAVDTIVISTSPAGPSCGFNFEKGETYLVYAYRGEIYSTSSCTRTKNINTARIDLHFLDRLPLSLNYSGLAGQVKYFGSNTFNKYQLPPIKEYTFSLVNDSLQFMINCDAYGEFFADSIPPGNYNIILNPDSDLDFVQSSSLIPGYERSELMIEVSEKTISEKTITLSEKNSITGTVLDENDIPIEGAIVYLIPEIYLSDTEKNYNYATFQCWTDSAGRYKFLNVPDGKYYLGINLLFGISYYNPYPVTYYRNSQNREDAELIEVSNGVRIKDTSLKIHKTYKVYKIRGRIESPDSIFWQNASVELNKTPDAPHEKRISQGISRRGTFEINVLEGTGGWLIFKPNNSQVNKEKGIFPITPAPVKIEPDSNYNDIIFTIETEKRTPVIYNPHDNQPAKNPLESKYEAADFIFTGVIDEIYSDSSEAVRYKIRVTKIFKGIKTDTLTIYYQSFPINILQLQEEYLISGLLEDNRYFVNPAGALPVSEAAEDISFLNTPPPPNSIITGKVFLYESNLLTSGMLPLMKNFSFHFHNLFNDYTVTTDSNGVYHTDAVIPGVYEIISAPDLNLTLHWNSGLLNDRIEISKVPGEIKQNLIFTIDNKVEGRVLDKNDRPLQHVIVDILPAGYSERYGLHNIQTWTDEDGNFDFSGLPDGKYNAGINIHNNPSAANPYPVTFYKDNDSSPQPGTIELKGGILRSDIILRPDKIHSIHSLTGKIVKPDSTPWTNSFHVYLANDQEGKKHIAQAYRGKTAGTFEIKILEFMEGWLIASAQDEAALNEGYRIVSPEPLRIEAGRDYENITIIIDPLKLEKIEKIEKQNYETNEWAIVKPESISDKNYFVPDSSFYRDNDSLSYLFNFWYPAHNESAVSGGLTVFNSKPEDTREHYSLAFYPDGRVKIYFDSSHFIELRWRKDNRNNSIIAIASPNDDVMYTYKIIELKKDILKVKEDGIFIYSVVDGEIHLESFRYSGNTRIKTTDLRYRVEEK